MLASSGNPVTGLIIVCALIGAYFVPSVVAFARRAPMKFPVLVINLLAGWTLIGWVVAMAMAVWPAPTPTPRTVSQQWAPGWYPSANGEMQYWDGTAWRR